MMAEVDWQGVNPGSEALKDLFEYFGPCLVLIDELVAFVRQLYGVQGLPAGSFDANATFAKALAEAARQSSRTLLVATVPASDIEIGGEAGKEALKRLKSTFQRIESPWRPASAERGSRSSDGGSSSPSLSSKPSPPAWVEMPAGSPRI